MGKVTKRERKFQASGGVKARIQKGTITKKGKLKKRKKASQQPHHDQPKLGAPAVAPAFKNASTDRDRSNDFLGLKNLAGLDIDSFFTEVTDQIEKGELDDVSESTGSSCSKEDEGRRVIVEHSKADDGSDNDKNDEGTASVDEPVAKFKERKADSSSSDSDSDDSSDDEDVENAEARMKKEMANMQKADPAFHKFLKENEESLLEFGEEDDAVSEDDEDGHEGKKDDGEKETSKKAAGDGTHVTPKVLKSLLQGAFKSKGIRSLKKLIGAYRSACHLADSSPEEETNTRPGESGKSYLIDSAKVFDQLMVQCLDHCHKAFHYHLLGNKPSADAEEADEENDGGDDENKPIVPKKLEKSPKWGDVKPILLSFFRSTLHIMSEAKDPELLTFILRALSKYLPYLSPFPHIATSALRSLLQLWSAPLESSEDYQVVRLNAFLRIRQLALTQPFPFIEECMKKTYLAYAKRARFGASSSMTALPTLTFMGNCIVELYSLDYHSAYQHAFVYIRQLALLLRTALQKKSSEAVLQVYCWQFMYSMKLWVAVLSAAAPTDDGAAMRSLIYPLTEVILGTSRLSPAPRYLPLRLQCVRLLHQLAAASETFIPTASLLLDCLDFKEWYLAPKKTRNAPRTVQMELILRLPSTDQQPCLRAQEQLEPAMNELMTLLQHEVELYRYSPGFPEYAIGMQQRLRKFCKETRQARWKAFARGCMDVMERYSAAAVQTRSKLKEAPRDVQRLEYLRPGSQRNMRERLRVLIEKERKASAHLVNSASTAQKRELEHEDDDEVEEKSKQKKKRRKQKPKEKPTAVKTSRVAEGSLDQEDEVQEGVDWSDDD